MKNNLVTISLEEYKELLEIKGKYEELKRICDGEFNQICENVKKEKEMSLKDPCIVTWNHDIQMPKITP